MLKNDIDKFGNKFYNPWKGRDDKVEDILLKFIKTGETTGEDAKIVFSELFKKYDNT